MTLALGVIELTTALVTALTVKEGRRAKRIEAGRGWRQIAFETWGRDVLRERSFVFLVASRLCILAGVSMFTREIDLYLSDALGLDAASRGFWLTVAPIILGAAVVTSCLPAARFSDRYGRKRLIFRRLRRRGAWFGDGRRGPAHRVTLAGAILIGVAGGTFLAVDWALMTDIIPKADSGRYMGLSNVATGLAGTVAVLSAGVIVFLVANSIGTTGLGYRVAFVLAVGFFALGAVLLRPVDPRRRDDDAVGPAPESGPLPL